MPQLHLPDFAPQIIWLAFTFITLYIFLARVVLPRIGTILEERRDRIARDLDEADKLKGETEQAIASYEQALAEARANAQAIAQKTRDKLDGEIEKERANVESQIADKTAEAETRIAASKSRALSHVNEAASDTAEAIIEKLIGGQIAKSDIKTAVNETLAK